MLTVVTGSELAPAALDAAAAQAPAAAVTIGGSLIDEIVRDGARRMLAAALEAEVAAYIAAHAGEVDERGRRMVVRNGRAQPRQVLTSDGGVGAVWPPGHVKPVQENYRSPWRHYIH